MSEVASDKAEGAASVGPMSRLFPDAPPVTHEEARNAAIDLINHFFRNEPRKNGGVLISIPARADNTDLVLMRYIEQQSAEAMAARSGETTGSPEGNSAVGNADLPHTQPENNQ